MDRITQEAYHRQRVIKWAKKCGVAAAAIRYHTSRKTVYKWLKRYDGTIDSLKDFPKPPHHCPRQQTPEEIQLVTRLVKKYGKDRLLAFEKAMEQGYSRSYGCFKRTARKVEEDTSKKKSSGRKNKLYARAEYPGQKVQPDVKFVPLYCVTDGKKYYQYTAKDECTRWTFREMYDEHSTASSYDYSFSVRPPALGVRSDAEAIIRLRGNSCRTALFLIYSPGTANPACHCLR